MNSFIVILPDTHGRPSVPETFPDFHYEIIVDAVWAVGATETTCSDVCKKLGIVEEERSIVVIKADDFYGYFDKALWEKLISWRDDL